LLRGSRNAAAHFGWCCHKADQPALSALPLRIREITVAGQRAGRGLVKPASEAGRCGDEMAGRKFWLNRRQTQMETAESGDVAARTAVPRY
jgi:hypothetical protein